VKAAADLERKLVEFQQYYNEHRTHAGRAGRPPRPPRPDPHNARASVRAYRPADALSWALSHAERRVTQAIGIALTTDLRIRHSQVNDGAFN
jgi:hypothetical protein